jgi:hypothetical protein
MIEITYMNESGKMSCMRVKGRKEENKLKRRESFGKTHRWEAGRETAY